MKLNSKILCYVVCSCVFSPSYLQMSGYGDSKTLSHQTWLPTTKLDFITTMLLDCCWLLTIKMVDSHVLVFMKVVDLDLSFKTHWRSINFDIYSSSYGQISGRKLDSDKTTILASKQNLKSLKAKLGFSLNIKV